MPCRSILAARHFSFNGFANFKPFKPANAMVSIIFRGNHKSTAILQPTDRYSPLIP